ncbi:MAG: hypothetical protein HYZ07_00480 [Candidatus Harrisonbacteria bacterium]|nr:hypothetical protein [Candidatus Harrisonbacteria bacterium]MBI3114419.1 hypothetical protein [Candidatus Harrisonbacteria bacterium]
MELNDAFSVAVTRRDNRSFLLRVAYVTLREGRWMKREEFFIGKSDSNLLFEKLWRAISAERRQRSGRK